MSNSILSSNGLEIANSRYFMDENEDWEKLSNRVGREVARAENGNVYMYQEKFSEMIYDMDFLPGGRILRNAGRPRGSLFNCYLIPIDDSIEQIGQFLKDSLTLWSEGGGVGTNLSFLRPRGAPIKGKGGNSSGPVSFLEAADAVASTIESGGQRRAAGLACMHVSHPDIIEFIDAKLVHGKIAHFNLSVLVDEDFLEAVESNKLWQFKFSQKDYGQIPAKEIWDKITANGIAHAEPGILHWDNIRSNNSYSYDGVIGSNPCGEAILEPYGICNLGSLVLTRFITGNINTNWQKLEATIKLAVRFLDDVIEVNKYVLKQNDIKAHNSRRLGIGVMGLAEYLFAKSLRYGSEKAIYEVEKLMRFIRDTVYWSSVGLAKEKGAFPKFDPVQYGKAHFVRSLPAKLRMEIKEHGVRNVTSLAIAPTGCQRKDSMIVSDDGILRLDEIGNINGAQWQPINYYVAQDFNKNRRTTKFYCNGETETKIIKLESGIELEATYSHKYKVLNKEKYEWKKIDELGVGDNLVVSFDDYHKQIEPQLIPVSKKQHFNNNNIKIVTQMNRDLAEFLGIYFGDGSNHHKGIRISCNAKNKKQYEYVAKLGQRVFGITPTFYDNGRNCMSVCFNSKLLLQFLKQNELLKQKSKHISIPRIIRCSSRNSLRAFIDGLWFADGSNTGKTKYIDTASKRLAQELLIIIRAVGNNTRLREHISGLGSLIYRIYIKKGVCKFYPKKLQNIKVILDDLGLCSHFIDPIVSVETSIAPTFDIEVPGSHLYVSNSVISHNTISLLPEVTSGIEPLFRKAYLRKDRVSDRIYVHPIYKDLLEQKEKVPEWFVDTDDLKPEDHLETQSVVQKYVDGAVSKTINMPKGTTKEDLSKLMLEYIHDLKGVTVYVDESREGQILNKITEKEVRKYIKENMVKVSADVETTVCATGSCEI